jgi:UDP-D-galactose:(glucosyl)LPS alpha-1,6-D-galactosyltransferase
MMNVSYLKYADYHLAISSQMVSQFKKIGIKKEKVYVVYNPVVIPKMKNHEFRKIKRDGFINICYIGRIMLDGQKNLRLLFDSLKQLTITQKKIVVLDVWGDGEIDKVKDYIEFLDFKDRLIVNWHGWVTNPWESIYNIDLLVLTSKFEGFGMALTEAISRGVPVVATDYPVGARDIIIPGLNGELASYNSTSVKNAIIKVLGYPLDTRKEIVNSINKFEIRKYSQNFCDALLKIMRR